MSSPGAVVAVARGEEGRERPQKARWPLCQTTMPAIHARSLAGSPEAVSQQWTAAAAVWLAPRESYERATKGADAENDSFSARKTSRMEREEAR